MGRGKTACAFSISVRGGIADLFLLPCVVSNSVHGRELPKATTCPIRKRHPEHYHFERNHQGLNNELIETSGDEPNMEGAVECHERLGGVLNSYRRAA